MPSDPADHTRPQPDQVPKTFDELVKSYGLRLNRIAEREMPGWLKRHVPAMDIVQDLLLSMIRTCQDSDSRAKALDDKGLYAYYELSLIHRITDNIRFYKRLKRKIDREQPLGDMDVPTNSPSPGTKAARNEFGRRWIHVMPELPERDRSLLSMFIDRGLSYQEIADEMRITRQSARQAVQRAAQHLFAAMRTSVS